MWSRHAIKFTTEKFQIHKIIDSEEAMNHLKKKSSVHVQMIHSL